MGTILSDENLRKMVGDTKADPKSIHETLAKVLKQLQEKQLSIGLAFQHALKLSYDEADTGAFHATNPHAETQRRQKLVFFADGRLRIGKCHNHEARLQ